MVGAAEQSVAAFGVRLELAVRTRLVPALIAGHVAAATFLVQANPSPLKPALQVQVKPPAELEHVASVAHPDSVRSRHSFTSVQAK